MREMTAAQYNKMVCRSMSERAWSDQFKKIYRRLGWIGAHFRPARKRDGTWSTAVEGEGIGFPDWVLLRPPRLLFVELKRETGKTTDKQNMWLSLLRLVPWLEVYVWKPSDFEEVERVLS